jgi:hypothetical protein
MSGLPRLARYALEVREGRKCTCSLASWLKTSHRRSTLQRFKRWQTEILSATPVPCAQCSAKGRAAHIRTHKSAAKHRCLSRLQLWATLHMQPAMSSMALLAHWQAPHTHDSKRKGLCIAGLHPQPTWRLLHIMSRSSTAVDFGRSVSWCKCSLTRGRSAGWTGVNCMRVWLLALC